MAEEALTLKIDKLTWRLLCIGAVDKLHYLPIMSKSMILSKAGALVITKYKAEQTVFFKSILALLSTETPYMRTTLLCYYVRAAQGFRNLFTLQTGLTSCRQDCSRMYLIWPFLVWVVLICVAASAACPPASRSMWDWVCRLV